MPKVEHELDTQNFEDYEEDCSKNLPAGGHRRRTDPNFIGYTFKNFEAVHPDAGAKTLAVSELHANRSVCLLLEDQDAHWIVLKRRQPEGFEIKVGRFAAENGIFLA